MDEIGDTGIGGLNNNATIEIFTQPGDLVVGIRDCCSAHAAIITRATPREEGLKVLWWTQCIFGSYEEAVDAVERTLTLITEQFRETNPFDEHVVAQYELVYAKQGLVFDPRLLYLTPDTINWIIDRLRVREDANTNLYLNDPAR